MYSTAKPFFSIPYPSFYFSFPPVIYLQYYLLAISFFCFLFLILIVLLKYLLFKSKVKKAHTILAVTIPNDTQQSAFSTEQLFTTIHTIGKTTSLRNIFLGRKHRFSLEIVATHEAGIRFLIYTTSRDAEIIKKNILSYMPYAKIEETEEYLPQTFIEYQKLSRQVLEMKFTNQFVYPLQQQTVLKEHDPIAYVTGHMTKLEPGEVVALQIVLSPLVPGIHKKQLSKIRQIHWMLRNGYDITPALKKSMQQAQYILPIVFSLPVLLAAYFFFLTANQRLVINIAGFILIVGGWFLWNPTKMKKEKILSREQTGIHEEIATKLSDSLFEASIRVYVQEGKAGSRYGRIQGLLTALSSSTRTKYQSLAVKRRFPFSESISFLQKYTYFLLKHRLVSERDNPVLSVAEVASLYHFPYTPTTKTEDLPKIMSPELPAPLLLKNATDLAVVFGKNTYGNSETPIGLTDDERSRHVYLIGQTGSGKSTILFHMAKDDIQKGKGVCVIDPHGDLVEDLLHIIPKDRIQDVVYVNPFDIKYPIGINLLELTPDLDEDSQELDKELVAENVISTFRRIFSKDENLDAHRIERILRNTIYTAFYVKDSTIFTVNKLLMNEAFRQEVLAKVDNEDLVDFWKGEFGKAGEWQVVKMISGVTAKVDRFLFSPIARRMLEQPHSTIQFDELLDQGKIILCNLSEGKLGEDTSQLLGTTIITKIHQAMLKRSRMDKSLRKPFYLYVDEFQNFATSHFTKLLSGGRKFGLSVTPAQQSTAQQSDRRNVDVLLANVGTVISFKTASPVDEEILLPQFSPLVDKGDLLNLPRHHFYMKLGAKDPQEPFSGETLPIVIQRDQKKVDAIIAASRKNFAIEYKRPKTAEKKPEQTTKKAEEPEKKIGSLT